MIIKKQLEKDIKDIVNELGYTVPTDTVLSISKNPNFGDYSTNIPLQLSKQNFKNNKQSPIEIANEIISKFGHPSYLERIEVAGGGFINFFIKPEILSAGILEIIKEKESFGKLDLGKGQKIEVEFISANPTGPLTLANGRGGALGDSLANVLSFVNYKVEREYYINDAGNQIKTLGESAKAAGGKLKSKDEHYQGQYIKELAIKFQDQLDKDSFQLGQILAEYLLENEIKPAITKLGVNFDSFYSEKTLYPDKIHNTLNILKDKNLAYEKDGAWWFKTSQFGDEKDRVLMTSKGATGEQTATYFLADLAHYLDVLSKKAYKKRINILGADHHSYAERLQIALGTLGYKEVTEVLLIQFVRLIKQGKEVKMSKRAGNFVTLDELLEEVSKDAIRFFFLMHAPTTHIDFNLDLAKEKSNKNPVYYVQYAHARMANILNKSTLKFKNFDTTRLNEQQEIELIKHLVEFSDLIKEIAENYTIHKLTEYTISLADKFHKFYEACPVLYSGNDELTQARLALIQASKTVLANSLKLLGVSAPERM